MPIFITKIKSKRTVICKLTSFLEGAKLELLDDFSKLLHPELFRFKRSCLGKEISSRSLLKKKKKEPKELSNVHAGIFITILSLQLKLFISVR